MPSAAASGAGEGTGWKTRSPSVIFWMLPRFVARQHHGMVAGGKRNPFDMRRVGKGLGSDRVRPRLAVLLNFQVEVPGADAATVGQIDCEQVRVIGTAVLMKPGAAWDPGCRVQ